MVPADTILDTAVEEGCDAVGLSGLITPSLDEMVVGRDARCSAASSTLPLLIGGATTSRQHTAVTIAPAYEQPTVHVLDASRVVGVVNDLLDADRRAALDADNRADQQRLRARSTTRSSASRCCRSSRRARNRTPIDWRVDDLAAPPFTGTREVAPVDRRAARAASTGVLLPRLGAQGPVPGDPRRPRQGAAARDLFDAANDAARRDRVADGSLAGARRLRLLAGRTPRTTTSCSPTARASRCCASRPTTATRRPNRSLADYIAPAETVSRTTSARSPSPSTAPTSWRHGYEARARRLQRDHGQGAGRPAGRGVRRVPAPAGPPRAGTRPTSSSTTDDLRASATAASGRRSATRPAPTTREKQTLFDAARRRGEPDSS